jgi:uncharacterized protein YndB with AHSA1/START domain
VDPVLTFDRRVSVEAPPARLFDYLADFTTTNEWDPRAEHTVRTTGTGGVGSRYDVDVRFLGRRTHLTYTITRLEPHERIEWVGGNRFVRAHDTIVLREEGSGTTAVDYRAGFAYPRLPRPLARLLRRPLARLCDDAQQGLQRTLTRRFAA